MSDSRILLERYVAAIAARDWETVGRLRHQDWSTLWPQSGELIESHDNDVQINENFPGYPDISLRKVEGSDPSYAVTPAFTLVRLSGAGEAWVAEGLNHYPRGDVYHVVNLIELREGKVHKETVYFAAPFEAPEWRARWVRRITTATAT